MRETETLVKRRERKRERERERERDRERDRETQRERETETERDRETHASWYREYRFCNRADLACYTGTDNLLG